MNILKNNKIKPIFAGVMVAICLLGIVVPQATSADFANTTNACYVAKTALKSSPIGKIAFGKTQFSWNKTIEVTVTAYSSTPEQTDDTPFITASGKNVRDGIIANNMLPFGTKVKIPSLYGNKVFIVEDRMNKKKSNYHIDIWMPSYEQAINFGVKTVQIEVLES